MAVTEAEVALAEIEAFINEHFRGRNLGFVMAVFCGHNTRTFAASAKTVSDEVAISFYNKMAAIYNEREDTNELPQSERMHSDRCRASIRSSKASNDAN